MDEISKAVGEGNIPFVAIFGVLLLTLGMMAGRLAGWGIDLERKVKDTSECGEGVFVVFLSVLAFLPLTYWGWYFLTDGSM